MSTLCALYGNGDIKDDDKYIFPDGKIKIASKQLRWQDAVHYSARQKRKMELGGIAGAFVLDRCFGQEEMSLLQAARIFSAGKGTNFGLGKVAFYME